MRVFIVGAGAVASVISNQLAKEKSVSEIVCGSINLKEARSFIDTRQKKISLKKLDASSIRQIVKSANGFDLIINASLPKFNENVLQAALQIGANYLDLCSELADLKHAEQLKFHKRFQKEGLVGLINAGVAPGITNLLAREAADKLDSVSAINIRLIEEQNASELIFAWSAEVALDTLTAPPLEFKNGKFVLLKPFGSIEDFEFPHPFGKRKLVSIYGDEVSTIPLYIKTKNVDFKSGGTDIELSKALFRLGLFNKKPVSLHGKKIVPIEFFSKIAPKAPSPKQMLKLIKSNVIENAAFTLVVEAIGQESNRKMKIENLAIFPDLKAISKKLPGATYISYPTGVAAAAFSKIIPKIDSFGVFPPEALDSKTRKQILIELEQNGIVIEEQFSKA